jgi:two-component system, cell cycle response regulator DivK
MPSTATVLIVDDYPDALEVWQLYLRGAGFEVLTATDGVAALALATSALPSLVVLDLELPGLSGLQVAHALKAEVATRHIPLIAVTGHSHQHQIDQALFAGFAQVLVKPCDPDVLVAAIHRLREQAAVPAASSGHQDSTSR